jgi:hypothetical protein
MIAFSSPLSFFSHSAYSKVESLKGSRLLPISDFHVGSDLSVILPHELLTVDIPKKPPPIPGDTRPPPPPPRMRRGASFPVQPFGARYSKSSAAASPKVCSVLGTLNGGLGVLIPVEERMYRRLAVVQQLLVVTVPTPLGLNANEYRVMKTRRFTTKKKGMLDSCILQLFFKLHPSVQEEMAAAVGVTAYTIMENMRELEERSNFF